ncbi:hypothetical protein SAMN04489834_2585 [Microterricola viridarii]|uniref:Uncharacterized protein n=1 Tax=Microterricola viridarii TaxID=412690 RepID=A0A1H1WP81_9MICO|nr:hypothetical protein SAMN04489834_2585 [Microterricola viridarii]
MAELDPSYPVDADSNTAHAWHVIRDLLASCANIEELYAALADTAHREDDPTHSWAKEWHALPKFSDGC